jgi:hypothetical protein
LHEAWLTTAAKPKALPSVCGVSCGYIVEWLTGSNPHYQLGNRTVYAR